MAHISRCPAFPRLLTTGLLVWLLSLCTGVHGDTYVNIEKDACGCIGNRRILRCTYFTNATDLTQTTITWTWLNGTNSYLVIKQRPTTLEEGDGYKGRVSLVKGPGEASLNISELYKNDTREYRCGVSVTSSNGGDKSDEMNLTVHAESERPTISIATTYTQHMNDSSKVCYTCTSSNVEKITVDSTPPGQCSIMDVVKIGTDINANVCGLKNGQPCTVQAHHTCQECLPAEKSITFPDDNMASYPGISIAIFVVTSVCLIITIVYLVVVYKLGVKCEGKDQKDRKRAFIALVVIIVICVVIIIVTAVVTEQDKSTNSTWSIALLVVSIIVFICGGVVILYCSFMIKESGQFKPPPPNHANKTARENAGYMNSPNSQNMQNANQHQQGSTNVNVSDVNLNGGKSNLH